MSTKPELSAKARTLINELIQSTSSKTVAEDRYTGSVVNSMVKQYDADKAALKAYVLRLERTVHRTRNELKAAKPEELVSALRAAEGFVAETVKQYGTHDPQHSHTLSVIRKALGKQRGMATETCLTFVVIGVLLLFGAITAVVERSMKHRQDQLKPSVDCVRPAPSKVYL